MKKNMGTVDRTIRVILALAIAVLYFMNVISGTLAIVLLVIAVVFVLTSVIGYCPLYSLLGISSRKRTDTEEFTEF
ncbi:YgaP family membrane protein [Sphingobacterium lactis]|uniref:YgaP family membrane protein n=1 Tax=Sphingobacterium lactis TaxID=797291 RepID=UPI003F80260F